MAKKILFLFYVFCLNIIYAQDITKLRILDKAELITGELIDKNIRDQNGDICSGIIIISDLTGLSYQSGLGIVKNNPSPGKDFLFVSPGERVINIFCSGYEPLKLILNDIGIKLTSGEVWQIKITSDKKLDIIPTIITIEPDDGVLTIDGGTQKSGSPIKLSRGKHEIVISKEGYNEKRETINLTEDNNYFRYTLKQKEAVIVRINSIPNKAAIFIDNIEKGKTDKDFFLFPGKYKIELILSGYLKINEDFIVKESGDNTFTYTFTKNAAELKIKVAPPDAKILINKEMRGSESLIVLAPGSYQIDISQEGYKSITEIVNLKLGEVIKKDYSLTAKTGSLQFTVQPVIATVSLTKEGKNIENWQGAKYIKGLMIGNYDMEIVCPGYETQKISVIIEENKTTNNDIEMKEGSDNTKMVFVEGGSFQMGSNDGSINEKPVHRVTINSFYIDMYEVTQAEYEKVMGKNPSSFKEPNAPVENVNWNDANEYAKKVGKRLPTEAEWEYAARGGSKNKGNKYSGSNKLDDVGWYDGNSGNKTHVVGLKKANELGIYDMNGNVWEWCSDWYGESYYSNSPVFNPKGPDSGSLHVLRGGSWTSGGNYCRVTYRNSINPDFRVNNFGFRCARDVDKLTNKAIELKQNNEKTFSCGTQISYAGKTYNTVQIGLQCWLKENLDVGTMIRVNKEQTNNNIIEKYCYDDNINNCNKYGGLYQWNEAMQYVTKGGVQGICPIGWHIPTKTEFETLEINVNKDGNALKEIGQGTGKAAGTNSSGFSALLAGSPSPTGSFFNLGTDTNF